MHNQRASLRRNRDRFLTMDVFIVNWQQAIIEKVLFNLVAMIEMLPSTDFGIANLQ